MVTTFEHIVPIISREGNVLVNRNGDVTFCYRYEGPALCSKTPNELDALTDEFAAALTFLPDLSIVHKKDIYTPRRLNTDYRAEKEYLTKKYLELYNEREYLNHRAYLFVTKISGLALSRGYDISLEADEKPEEHQQKKTSLREEITTFENILSGWARFMCDSGMHVYECTEEELDEAIEGHFVLHEQDVIADIDFEARKIGFQQFDIVSAGHGSQYSDYVRAYRLNPEYMRFAKDMQDVKGARKVGLYSDFLCGVGYSLRCGHEVNQYFFIDGKSFWDKEIEKRRKDLGAWRFFSAKNGYHAEKIKEFEDKTIEQNELVVRFHFNVMFWTDQDKLSETRAALRSAFKEMGITPRLSSRDNVRILFLGACPGNAGVVPFEDTMTGHASSLSSLLIKERVRAEPLKKGKKGLLFTDRVSGALIQRDCWFAPYESKQIANRNFLGIGKSGSGKSSMTIEVIRQYLGMNFNCTVLDIGRSFEVLAKHYNGNYIIYEDGLGLGINPFALPGQELSNALLEFLAQFTAVLWKPNRDLSDDEVNALEKVILASYKGKRDPNAKSGFVVDGDYQNATIQHLYGFVDNNKGLVKELTMGKESFFDVDSFLLSIEKFVAGKFDRLFTDNNSIDPDKNLTVWELDNVKDHKTLFPILSMLITYMTTEVIWKKTDQEKIVLIEEAWKMLEKPGMTSYIKWLYKTIRKFDGAVGINIQQIGDIAVPNTNIKETILANSDVKFIMSHTPSMAKELAHILDWDDYRLALLLSIPLDEDKAKTSGGRRFSELLSVVGEDVRALQLMVSDEQIVNFMSEMKDKEKLFKLVASHDGDWRAGIDSYVKKYMQ